MAMRGQGVAPGGVQSAAVTRVPHAPAAAPRRCRSRCSPVAAAFKGEHVAAPAAAAAAAAAVLLNFAQPALAEATLFDSGSKNVQELQDIIASRGAKLPGLKQVPQAAKEAATAAVKDTPLEKIQGTIKSSRVEIPDNVPKPLDPPKLAEAAMSTTQKVAAASTPAASKGSPAPAAAKPAQAVQAVKDAVPSLPAIPLPEGGPQPKTLAGIALVMVAGGAAVASASKQGELPSLDDLQTALQEDATVVKKGGKDVAKAADKAADKVGDAAKSAADKTPQSAEEAAKLAKESAAEARTWIDDWRKKQ